MANKWLEQLKAEERTAPKPKDQKVPKPVSEGGFVSFVSGGKGINPIIEGEEPPSLDPETTPVCPPMPAGVRLVNWEPKVAPVAIDVCSVVTDVQKFIAAELQSLDHRLNNPWCVRGGWTVPQMVDRLAQVGLVIEVDVK